MSHYLQNIAARSLDATPTVQPRLAARFETVTNPAGAANGATNIEVEEAREDPAISPAAASPQTISPALSHAQPDGSVPVASSSSVRPIVPLPTETIRPLPPTSLITPTPTAAVPPQSSAPPLASEDDVSPARPPHAAAEASERLRPESPEAADAPQRLSPILDKAISAPGRSPDPNLAQTTSPPERSPAANPSPLLQPIQPAPAPQAHPAPSPAPAPQPPIQVTIGRIDVQAITLPATARPRMTKSSPPQSSLADYLKARRQSLGQGR